MKRGGSESEEPGGAGTIGGGLCSGGERDGGFCMETKARGANVGREARKGPTERLRMSYWRS